MVLLDTGASISIISEGVVKKWSQEQRGSIVGTNVKVKVANDMGLPVTGEVVVELVLGGHRIAHKCIIADITSDVLLGLDFLRAESCSIDITSKSLHWRGIEVPLRDTPDRQQSCRVTVCQTVVVPAQTEMVIAGQLGRENKQGEYGIIEPALSLVKKNSLILAPSLVSSTEETVPVRLMNPSDKPVTLYRGTTAGIFEIVNAIGPNINTYNKVKQINQVQPGQGEGSHPLESECVPAHLENLYQRSASRLNGPEKVQLRKLLIKNDSLFSKGDGDIGQTSKVKHRIETGSALPIKQQPRRLPIHQREVAEKEISDMLSQGVIKPGCGPWASPIVLVRKKDGRVRFCVDYRRLNAVTQKDAYPIPRIDDTIDSLAGSIYFTTLDLSSGYWQVPMDEEHKEKTAFSTHVGLYQFEVMPFGLCNAPSTFERLMESVLRGLQWQICLVYLDDVIVFSHTFEEHVERLQLIFDRIKEAGLKLKPGKCHMLQQRVNYLGHVVSDEGVHTDPEKIRKVKEWPVPMSVHEVRSFLGLASYYRRFVPDFAALASPLHKLTEKGREFHWSSECQRAFDQLRQRLIMSPILAYPTATHKFILDTDASDFGIGAVLSQSDDKGVERVIAYASRSLTKSEKNYCVTRKELLSLVHHVKHFRPYLYGQQFKIRTDHGALKWLLTFKNPEGQTARWLQVLAEYDFVIEHRPGRRHGNADALSRMPCRQCKNTRDNWEEQPMPNTSDKQPSMESPQIESAPRCVAKQEHKSDHCNVLQCQTNPPRSRDDSQEEPVVATEPNWLAGMSYPTLLQKQREDPVLSKVISWFESDGRRPPWSEVSAENAQSKAYWGAWDQLTIQNGILQKKWENDTGEEIRYLLVIPSSMTEEILQQLHDSPTGGHLGVRKLYEKVKARFYWRKMHDSVTNWCKKCLACAQQKMPQRRRRAPLKQQVSGVPLERMAIDITGPFPITNDGNRYIVVVSDYFSKWTEAFPVPNIESETIARVLVDRFICRFGVPRQIHSDQGRQFESRLFQDLCDLLGIDKTRTTPYHPQSDGQVERFNRTLIAMLASYVSTNQKDWDKHVQTVLMAYRASPHESTGITPNKMMFGREVDLPIDTMCVLPREGHRDVSSYVSDLEKRLESAHELARIRLKQSACYQRRQYNLKADEATFEVGSAVMIRVGTKKVGLSPKLQPKWDGPYIVTHRLSDVVVRIQRGPRHKPKVLHVNRMKPFQGDVDKTWLSSRLAGSAIQPEVGEHQDRSEKAVPLSQSNAEECQDGDELPENLSSQRDEGQCQDGEEVPEALSSRGDEGQCQDKKEVSERFGNSADGEVSEPLGNTPRRKRKPPDRYGEWCT